MAWLLSVSTFSRTENGFAGFPVSKPFNLDDKSVTFARDRHGAKQKTGRTSAHAVCLRRRVRNGTEGACLSSSGQSLLLGKAG